jgi:hypothetical protein
MCEKLRSAKKAAQGSTTSKINQFLRKNTNGLTQRTRFVKSACLVVIFAKALIFVTSVFVILRNVGIRSIIQKPGKSVKRLAGFPIQIF